MGRHYLRRIIYQLVADFHGWMRERGFYGVALSVSESSPLPSEVRRVAGLDCGCALGL
jgi:hypothetical protein